ncbi:MAG TPA: pyruvate kinase [Acidimicrobiales bacterium]|nr:pyruvate kinase [Acidimicrobiales bacterium]
MRRTKIVATIGPATETPAAIEALVAAGMDMARLSLSHGPVEETLERIERVRVAARRQHRFVGVLADLPGPKIRAAEFPEGGIRLTEGSSVELVPGELSERSDAHRIVIDHAPLLEELQPGDEVAFGDGSIRLVVQSVDAGRAALARVRTEGWAQGRPGVALPPERTTLSAPTDEDLRLLEIVADAGVDAVAVSFVRAAADIERARSVRSDAFLIAKIETAEAVNALNEIIGVSDGVMVARGDLGLRCALEDVPHHQKRIIRTGVAFGRPVITATQMLESMVRAPSPTRAEVTDIANAVFDGTSALMLSAETAIGSHPTGAVQTMARIAERAERDFDYMGWGRALGRVQTAVQRRADPSDRASDVRITAAVSAAAWRAAVDAEVAAVIACTNTGATARAISRFRPSMPLIAATPSERTARQLSVAWGITPVLSDRHETTDDIVWFAVKATVERGLVEPGQLVAVLVGSPVEPNRTTDTLRLVRIS